LQLFFGAGQNKVEIGDSQLITAGFVVAITQLKETGDNLLTQPESLWFDFD
jgi:hypothetical protein